MVAHIVGFAVVHNVEAHLLVFGVAVANVVAVVVAFVELLLLFGLLMKQSFIYFLVAILFLLYS